MSLNLLTVDASVFLFIVTYKEVDQILKRYSTMDSSSQGKEGITLSQCYMMPEFTACVFSNDVIRYYKDKESKRIHPRNFMRICTMFCRRTPAIKKKQCMYSYHNCNVSRFVVKIIVLFYVLFVHIFSSHFSKLTLGHNASYCTVSLFNCV